MIVNKHVNRKLPKEYPLNPEIAGKKTGTKKSYDRIMRELKSVQYDKILNDNSLDLK